MLEKGKISERQLIILIIFFIVGTSIIVEPTTLVAVANQDGWMASILGLVLGVLLVVIYSRLSKRFPAQSLVEICEQILGKWIGKLVALSFVSFSFLLSSIVLRNLGDFLTTQVMPETPIQFVHILFLIVIVLGVRLGIETIARTSEIVFSWVIGAFIVFFILLLPKIELKHIQPVFEDGFKPMFEATIHLVSFPYMELIIFLMLIPYVQPIHSIRRNFILGTVIGGTLLTIMVTMGILVLGPDFAERNIYTTYILGKVISIGDIFERIEVVSGIIWMTTIYFKLVILFYATVLGMAQIFNLEGYKSFLFPLGMIMVIVSLIVYPNMVYFQYFALRIWPLYITTYGLFLPILLLIVASIRKKSTKASL